MSAATFTLEPRGPFSLRAAAGFGFGPRETDDDAGEAVVRLAFCVDGYRELAGVVVRQDAEGTVGGEIHGGADAEAVRDQVARVLSLDHDATAWAAVGERDPVIGRLQAAHPGLRPVLFHSPYEAAAWAILSTRSNRRQATAVRDRLAETAGGAFELAGRRLLAFPVPERLLAAGGVPGLPEEKLRRLHGIAEAALDGRLDAARLRALEPDAALEEVQALRGIGPFAAALIVVRSLGHTDVLPPDEPRSRRVAAELYGLDAPPDPDAFRALAEPWRPFRTWTAVLLRASGDRDGP